MEPHPARYDDEIIDKVLVDLGRLEGSVETLHDRQTAIFNKLDEEKEQHFDIRGKVSAIGVKLDSIEKVIKCLREDKIERKEQVEAVIRSISELEKTIRTTTIDLSNLTQGAHAATHKWAENRMESEKRMDRLKRRILEKFLTKSAHAVLFLIIFLIGLGAYTYFTQDVNLVPIINILK